MFRGRLLGTILALMLIVGLFSLASSSIYRAGWTQGYFTGKITDAAESGAQVVGPDGRAGQAHFPGFSPLASTGGGIIKFFLFFIFGALFLKMFFGMIFWSKRGHWGKKWKHGRGWHEHADWGRGHRPPWFDDTADEPVMKV